jgi:hypothetical protein
MGEGDQVREDQAGVRRPTPSFRGEADEGGREPGIHNHRPGVMDSGLASATLRRPGMTILWLHDYPRFRFSTTAQTALLIWL